MQKRKLQKKRNSYCNKCPTLASLIDSVYNIHMKFLKFALVLVLFPLIAASTDHKFYVSTTNVEYAVESKSIQMISKIFIEDIEDALQQRYSPDVSLDTKKETPQDLELLKKYVKQKFIVYVNGAEVEYEFLGHEYELDIVKCYLEIENISELHTIEFENKILMDLFDDQKNIIHVKTPNSRRSIVLDVDNPKGLLNFD